IKGHSSSTSGNECPMLCRNFCAILKLSLTSDWQRRMGGKLNGKRLQRDVPTLKYVDGETGQRNPGYDGSIFEASRKRLRRRGLGRKDQGTHLRRHLHRYPL